MKNDKSWRRQGFGMVGDTATAIQIPIKPFGPPTGEWFCSVCLKIKASREKHEGCHAEPSDMDVVIKSDTI